MSYVWRTMEDDRVRPSHAARNGLVFDDNYRPEPGEEYNCRCIREATEEVEDEDKAAPPNPWGTFGATFATSFGLSVGREFYNTKLAPKLGLKQSAGTGTKTGILFTGINYFTEAGSTSQKLGSAAISLATTFGLAKLTSMLPGYGKLIGPGFLIAQGLITGESAGNIAAKVTGSLVGSKLGGALGAELFSTGAGAGAVFQTATTSRPVTNEALLTKVGNLNKRSVVADTKLQGLRLSALSDAFQGKQVTIQPIPQDIKNLMKSVKQVEKARIKQGPFQQQKVKGLEQLAKKLRNGRVF